jgi:3-hydroxybutyryl-CoA dehydratase
VKFFIAVGESAEFTRSVSEEDLARFAELSGDFDPIHMDEAYAAGSRYGRRIAHGILGMAPLSAASSIISRRAKERGAPGVSVSLGYDRIRFLKPVYIGDTLTARYTVQALEGDRSRSKVEVVNQRGELVVAGEHIMKWLPE